MNTETYRRAHMVLLIFIASILGAILFTQLGHKWVGVAYAITGGICSLVLLHQERIKRVTESLRSVVPEVNA